DEKRDMEWSSPWGIGFPGWHLECSVMAREILGDQIDIHTGGIDHIPVHHTNEIAQTEAITAKNFSNFWVHANHIKVDGTKMSKSLGNIYTLQDILDKGYHIEAFKLLVLSKHYRTEGNFTWEILDDAQNVFNKFNAWSYLQFQNLKSERLVNNFSGNNGAIASLKRFVLSDLDTPGALSFIHGMVSRTEELGADSQSIAEATRVIEELLGIRLAKDGDITSEQKQLIKVREAAREAKNWTKSDELRDKLLEQDIEVKDTPNGTIWSKI
ncbi:cysteine--tRNA ligase, partial [Candidatus Saccharibacteria bacterium]|nr:cysteine--tRNA ligase [Candidatus Saccharibacteria bacterium]